MRTRAAAFLAAATPFVVGGYAAYQTTFGDVWSHNAAFDQCTVAAPDRDNVSTADRTTWWPPLGHAHRCVYRLPSDCTVVRPVPK